MKKILLTWAGILFFIYFLLEVFFLRYISFIFPLASLGNVPPGGSLLVQYSKNSPIPQNYIAILGDSYAFGQGDWQLSQEDNIRPLYHAGHLLHKKTDEDVISIGMPASGSIRAYNILPEVLLNYTNQASFYSVSPPKKIIAYFYEGNDLADNFEMFSKRIQPILGKSGSVDDTLVMQSAIKQLVESDDFMLSLQGVSWVDKLFFFQFVKNLMLDFYEREIKGNKLAPWKNTKIGRVTAVLINGEKQYLPQQLQTPALTLSKQEMAIAFEVFKQSLVYLKKRFPNSDIGVAYIPAVITPYHVVSGNIHTYYKDPRKQKQKKIQKAAGIQTNSDYICEKVRGIVADQEMAFVDSRHDLRLVAEKELIHGPIDWQHFNRKGYETFSKSLLLLLDNMKSSEKRVAACQW